MDKLLYFNSYLKYSGDLNLFIDELKCTPFRTRLKYALQLKSDEDVKAAELLKAETLKDEDYNEFEEILGMESML